MPYDKTRSFRYPLEARTDNPVRSNGEGKTWTCVLIFLVIAAVTYAGSDLPDRPDADEAAVKVAAFDATFEATTMVAAPAAIYHAEPAPGATTGNVSDLTY